MLSVRNNDVTRVRAELESASFVSAVPPRIAVRLLHIAALAVVLKFLSSSSNDGSGSSSSKRLEYVNKVRRLSLPSKHSPALICSESQEVKSV
jgi:hypothetical protein